MMDRPLNYIVKDQRPLVRRGDDMVRNACQAMWERRTGSVLVVDDRDRLVGIFTGRDAVRLVAKGRDADQTPLATAMMRDPVTVTPRDRAVDALRAMSGGGFRHVPVVDNGKTWVLSPVATLPEGRSIVWMRKST